jgi:hypothetical protein
MDWFSVRVQTLNRALEPTAARELRTLAFPSPLRFSAAAQRERRASRIAISYCGIR